MENDIVEILEKHIRESEDKILLIDYKIRNIKSILNTSRDEVKQHFELLLKYFENMRELYIVKLRILELAYELFLNNLISRDILTSMLRKIESVDISREDISEIVTNVLDKLRIINNSLHMLRSLYETLRSYSSAELS
ncbi:MAG: hypothetical protein GXO26_07235 [Crenarchaeota archaeon]|nr:hypothetical protein [Thermoproteota archaeon]